MPAALGCLDLGAGRGELLAALAGLEEEAAPLRLHGVDVVDRPALLPPRVDWTRADRGVPYGAFERALVVAWELLDTVPCPVLEVDEEGRPRLVLVEPATGRERLGGVPSEADLRWCERWWPLEGLPEGSRAEVGTRRDAWWTGHVRLLARLGGGVLLGRRLRAPRGGAAAAGRRSAGTGAAGWSRRCPTAAAT